MKNEDVEVILKEHDINKEGLISILQDVQKKYGYLPQNALNIVSEKTGRSMVDIYGVATFYKSFRLKPIGKHLISVCLGTACHVRGGNLIAEEFTRQLGIKAGETTADREFTLKAVNCLGACALGPIVVVDGNYFSNVHTSMVKQIIEKAREGLDKVEIKTDERIFPLEVGCPRCNHNLMDPDNQIDDYPSIKVTTSFGRKHGWLRLSSLYGSYTTESEYEIPFNTIHNFFCPHCHAELTGVTKCPNCDAPMVSMIVRGGGMVQICSRKGCREHMLDLNGINL